MPWELAEKAVVAAVQMDLKMQHTGNRIEEYIILVSPSEDEVRKPWQK